MFVFSGFCLVGAGVLFWLAYDSYRMLDSTRAALAASASVVLIVAGASLFVVVSRYPGLDFWNSRGHGPGWECLPLGRGAADVCQKDRPAP